jgi:hypothetical protein
MSKYAKWYRVTVIFPLTFLLLSFATNRTTKSTLSDIATIYEPSDIHVFSQRPVTVSNAKDFVSKLPSFIGKREDFIDLSPATKLVFSHSFDALGLVRLSAWVLDENDNFEKGKRIDLVNNGPSGTDNEAGLVFGNVVLKPGQLGKIRKELRRNEDAMHIIFRPVIVDDYFVGYKIGISESKAVGADFVEFAEANPSPPKVY